MLVVKDKIYNKLFETCYKSKFQKATFKKKKIILLGTKLYLYDNEKIINEKKYETAYLSLTRGDGGQN